MSESDTKTTPRGLSAWNTDRCEQIVSTNLLQIICLKSIDVSLDRSKQCSNPKKSGFDEARGKLWTSRYCKDHHRKRRRYFKTLNEYNVWKENEKRDRRDEMEASDEQEARCNMCSSNKSFRSMPFSEVEYLCYMHIKECKEFLKELAQDNALMATPKRNRDDSEEESEGSDNEVASESESSTSSAVKRIKINKFLCHNYSTSSVL